MRDQRRRRWSLAEKAALVRRSYEPGMSVSLTARQEGVSASLLFQWRKCERQGALTAVSAGEAVVPASELAACPGRDRQAAARAGQEDAGERDPQGGRWLCRRKKVDCALILVGRGRPVKVVCEALGLARSNVQRLRARSGEWTDARTCRTSLTDDAVLLEEIKAQIAELPTYGYRRACALVNRHRAATGALRVNAKRVYRVMAGHALLLPKAPRRRQSSRPHEGKVAVAHSDMHWCSDGFEIRCDSGQTVTATFTKDCCDREILAYRAWEGKGLPGEPVREMLIEAVEKRFGDVDGILKTHTLEFLSDNGGAYIAAETRQIARQLGLRPINTPVCSPQSNGMAESFVNTFKRDYVSRMDLANAKTVMAQMAMAFEHFNEVHSHSALKMRSPKEFRQHCAAQQGSAQLEQMPNCE